MRFETPELRSSSWWKSLGRGSRHLRTVAQAEGRRVPRNWSPIPSLFGRQVQARLGERNSNLSELGKRRFKIFYDLAGDYGGGGEVVGVLEALITEPEDVEARLVASHKLLVRKPLEALGFPSLMPTLGPVTDHEVFKVFVAERPLLQRAVP